VIHQILECNLHQIVRYLVCLFENLFFLFFTFLRGRKKNIARKIFFFRVKKFSFFFRQGEKNLLKSYLDEFFFSRVEKIFLREENIFFPIQKNFKISNQARLPTELKHINKWRKRK